MRLTEQQLRFFHRFGYLVVRGLLSPAETAEVTEAFERTMTDFANGLSHDGKRRTWTLGPIEHDQRLCRLLDHPGVLGLAGGVLGEDFNYACGDGSFYAGDTGWHPDGHHDTIFSCKLAFYLDPVTRDTGALRVLPGSHDPRHPLHLDVVDMRAEPERLGILPREVPGAEALESRPGDAVLFAHNLYHAAFGGGARRRMFTLNLTRRAETPDDHERLRRWVRRHTPGGYGAPSVGMYFRPLLDSAGPERRRHLEQCAAIHDEFFPRTRDLTHAEQCAAMRAAISPKPEAAAYTG